MCATGKGENEMHRTIRFFILVLVGVALLFASAEVGAARDLSDHPLIKPYPGSKAVNKQVGEYAEIVLPQGKITYRGVETVFSDAVEVSGKVTGIDYRTPRERTLLEVLTNYKQGLTKGGFKILFSCLEGGCGNAKFKSPYLRYKAGGGYAKTGFLTAKLERGEGDVYVLVGVDQNNGVNTILVIESKPMETGLVKVDANALSAEIDRTGHASIYGILFDTDKAEVKPESKQALGEIAKLLEKRPKLKLYVVGHTDSVGTLDYNLDLSRRRAAAVVMVLAQEYKIDRKRLKSAGVGPLAPVLANTSDGGRAKNRRVELVAQ